MGVKTQDYVRSRHRYLKEVLNWFVSRGFRKFTSKWQTIFLLPNVI